VTEGAVLGELTKLGLDVLVPFRHDLPYDPVVHIPDGPFLRVQCKSGRERDGCVVFNSASTDHGSGRQDYRGWADVFAVHCPTLDRVFMVPVDAAASRGTCLRLEPTRNGQRARTRPADEYAVERWAAQVLVRGPA
jgi:hypothetical protein